MWHPNFKGEMGLEDITDAGLALALGYDGKKNLTMCSSSSMAKPGVKLENSSFHSSDSYEPSLTLGRQSSSSHSTVSISYSNVKRKCGDQVGEEDHVKDEEEDGGGTGSNSNGNTNRKKLRLTKDQSALLEERFKEHSTLNPKQKLALSKQLSLLPRQVEVWFQNRRARTKLKQTEVEFEFLKRCCEMLTDENRRLQKEVQELKALNLMTICPSCGRVGGANDDLKMAAGGGATTFLKTHFCSSPFTSSQSAAC